MLRAIPNLSKQSEVAAPLLLVVLLGGQDFQHTRPCLIDGIQHRGRLLLQNLHIAGHELLPQFRQLGNVGVGLFLTDDGAHLRHNVLQLCVHDVGLAVIVDRQHIQSAGEDGQLLTSKERLNGFIILSEVVEVIPLLGNHRKEVHGRLNLHNGQHQVLAGLQHLLTGVAVFLVVNLQPFLLVDGILRIPLEVLHDGIFVLRRSSGLEHFFHNIPDSLFILIRDAGALFHQQLLHKRLLGDEADDLFLGLVIQTYGCPIDGEGQISALKQAGNQPEHIVLHKSIGSFHKAILHALHGGLHVVARIHGNKALNIVQRVSIALGATFQPERKLITVVEHLADLRLTHRSVDVRQLVVDRLYQTTNGLIDPSADFLAVYADNIAVYIDRCFFQRFGQVELCVLAALPHFHALCLL